MDPRERRIRVEVGLEIVEGVILDFLRENPGVSSPEVRRALDLRSWNLSEGLLIRLNREGKIVDTRTGTTGPHRWRVA